MVYEIELKALLTKKQYDELVLELTKKARFIKKDTIHTTRYRPGDVRIRYSEDHAEILCKQGDPTELTRKETVLALNSKNETKFFTELFETLGMKADPPWVKHRHTFEYELNKCVYELSLQNIPNFAYILEAEYVSEKDESNKHEPNLKQIFEELGCEAIEPNEFKEKINDYIKDNR